MSTQNSVFLFGPRGTGKTSWLRSQFPDAIYLDLLENSLFTQLLARPQDLQQYIPPQSPKSSPPSQKPTTDKTLIIIDEVQRIPALLNEVHRLIESPTSAPCTFILTGSNPRKLRKNSSNLLAGRALTHYFHPFTSHELGANYDYDTALNYGLLPSIYDPQKDLNPQHYLASYVHTYLKEEIQEEGLTRQLANFARFLEAASFSQASVLSMAAIARDAAVHQKVVENYFTILDDLLIAIRLPVFNKKAKRRLTQHPKFFFFDTGVYRSIRPSGPLDAPEEIDGAAIETLILQELRATNDNFQLGYNLYYWRTANGTEVDFILYGEKGLIAIEVKRTARVRNNDLSGLKSFARDYPQAQLYFLYGGERTLYIDNITVLPIGAAMQDLPNLLHGNI